ncbi:MAG TPA: carbon monoxide dehydrogenase subunit G [Micromonosporaceae bacterium]|nr:carbon monoxide dehydrogenase subunit G [Micromonosporaceae bacterium]
MRFTGEHTLSAPVERVWDALLDPAVLVRTIPGCERLEATGENAYAMTVTAGVAAIRGTYTGTCVLSDLVPHESLTMRLTGAGAPGTVGAKVHVRFAGAEDATTVSYDADAVVGGMVGGVGQRMLTSVSRRMAGEFFGNVGDVLSGAVPPGTAALPTGATRSEDGGMPRVYTDAQPGRQPSQRDFLAGVAVGAGLVLLGVLVGRRR